ncbi:MAG: hypothetical protein NTV52_09215 [Acidobacteria bacterium]|nr:hypothetical protein [Acidobacteriota bacterium]
MSRTNAGIAAIYCRIISATAPRSVMERPTKFAALQYMLTFTVTTPVRSACGRIAPEPHILPETTSMLASPRPWRRPSRTTQNLPMRLTRFGKITEFGLSLLGHVQPAAGNRPLS